MVNIQILSPFSVRSTGSSLFPVTHKFVFSDTLKSELRMSDSSKVLPLLDFALLIVSSQGQTSRCPDISRYFLPQTPNPKSPISSFFCRLQKFRSTKEKQKIQPQRGTASPAGRPELFLLSLLYKHNPGAYPDKSFVVLEQCVGQQPHLVGICKPPTRKIN